MRDLHQDVARGHEIEVVGVARAVQARVQRPHRRLALQVKADVEGRRERLSA